MTLTYGSLEAILHNNFPQLSPAEQKEGILLLRQRGMTKREILQKTRLFPSEYNQLFENTFRPHRLEDPKE